MIFDRIIIGAGLYGLYAALESAKMGRSVLVLEHDNEPFKRATYINQARVHMGYHYPRSLSTAEKSAAYFERFNDEYGFCVNSHFHQIYATSKNFSWTNAEQFKKFCVNAGIPCKDVSVNDFFNYGMCDGAFITEEYTYDAQILKEYFLEQLAEFPRVTVLYNQRIQNIVRRAGYYHIVDQTGAVYDSEFILNATYASTNQILSLAGFAPLQIKYELCEIIICKASERLKDLGITVMDGPFFSVMPFGKTGFHTLTSVTFTPHKTCWDALPSFSCQRLVEECDEYQLSNCNDCPGRPESAWQYMSALASKYLQADYKFDYLYSLFSMKPILKTSEIDDSRPTVIRKFSDAPVFISVLSGKINTVYDLDEVLKC